MQSLVFNNIRPNCPTIFHFVSFFAQPFLTLVLITSSINYPLDNDRRRLISSSLAISSLINVDLKRKELLLISFVLFDIWYLLIQ